MPAIGYVTRDESGAYIRYLDQSECHRFAPGARVRPVKAWGVKHLKLAERDAAEHVLQLCESTDRRRTHRCTS